MIKKVIIIGGGVIGMSTAFQLAEKGNYIETCYLLLNGELPDQDEFNKLNLNDLRK